MSSPIQQAIDVVYSVLVEIGKAQQAVEQAARDAENATFKLTEHLDPSLKAKVVTALAEMVELARAKSFEITDPALYAVQDVRKSLQELLD